jgi:hypothetical protein
MDGVASKTFDKPDETRMFETNGHVEMITLAGRSVGRGTFEPGWRWSNDVKPIAGTDSCQVSHLGYVMSGRMRITMDDGTTQDLAPGDVFAIAPGHDAEVLGDESCVSLDFGEIGDYARRT